MEHLGGHRDAKRRRSRNHRMAEHHLITGNPISPPSPALPPQTHPSTTTPPPSRTSQNQASNNTTRGFVCDNNASVIDWQCTLVWGGEVVIYHHSNTLGVSALEGSSLLQKYSWAAGVCCVRPLISFQGLQPTYRPAPRTYPS